MKARYAVAFGIVAGFGLGAVTVQGQSKSPTNVIGEINIRDKDRYIAEFFPTHIKGVEEAGGTYVVIDGKPTTFQEAPPGDRVVILRFQDMEKARAWYNSADRVAAGEIGDKYANFRIFAVEGFGQ